MEMRIRYVVVGLFVLIVGLASIAFVLWIQNQGSIGGKLELVVRFEGPAPGLRAGAPVTFNGVRVGDVTRIAFDATNLSRVDAYVSLNRGTPVSATTKAALDSEGVLGAVTLSLTGGDPKEPLEGAIPVLFAAQTASLSQEARETLSAIRGLVSDNSEGIHETIENIRSFSALLSRNSDRIDSILKGLEKTLSGSERDVKPVTYDLPAPTTVSGFDDVPEAKVVVNDPTTLVVYDTQRLLVETTSGEITPQPIAWPDSIPKLVQRRVLQTFDNLGYKSASSPIDNATPDYQLSLDIQAFQIIEGQTPVAKVSFHARLLDADGKLLEAHLISGESPVSSPEAQSRVLAIRSALSDALRSLLLWYKTAVPAGP